MTFPDIYRAREASYTGPCANLPIAGRMVYMSAVLAGAVRSRQRGHRPAPPVGPGAEQRHVSCRFCAAAAAPGRARSGGGILLGWLLRDRAAGRSTTACVGRARL